MTEIFSVMMLAWPNAELFKGGIQKLGPTIGLWAGCLNDVNYPMGRLTVIDLCKTCKFPPTMAEFGQRAREIREALRYEALEILEDLKTADLMGRGLDEYCKALPEESRTRKVIQRLGGPDNLIKTGSDGSSWWNFSGIVAACEAMAIQNVSSHEARRKLPMERKE